MTTGNKRERSGCSESSSCSSNTKKRRNVTRLKYNPLNEILERKLEQTNIAIAGLEWSVEKRHSYLDGVFKKPFDTKIYQFSKVQRKSELTKDILDIENNHEKMFKIKSQKVCEYHKVLEKLVLLKEEYLEILQCEKSELYSVGISNLTNFQ